MYVFSPKHLGTDLFMFTVPEGLRHVLCLPYLVFVFTIPAGLMCLCLPSLRVWCVVFTVPVGMKCSVFCLLSSLRDWYIVFTVVPAGLMCYVLRGWCIGVYYPYRPGWCIVFTVPSGFGDDVLVFVFTVPAGLMCCVCSPFWYMYYVYCPWGAAVLCFTAPAGLMYFGEMDGGAENVDRERGKMDRGFRESTQVWFEYEYVGLTPTVFGPWRSRSRAISRSQFGSYYV